MNQEDKLAAIAVSDIHLSLLKPRIREDSDWLKVQKEYLNQLYSLLSDWSVPIIFAGDLFDRWSQPPELINWCLDNLPEMYGVYGQHDEKHHVARDLDKTAFGTMVKVGKIKLISPKTNPTVVNNLVLWGFPWNSEVHECPREPRPDYLHVAVIHAYIWTQKTGYIGALEEKRLGTWLEKLKRYDIAVFGDNHHGFLYQKEGQCTVINNGTFIRRKADEINLKPSVGLIYQNGKVIRHYLDISKDKFIAQQERIKIGNEEIELFVRDLNNLEHKTVDFPDAVRRAVDSENIREEVKIEVLKILEQATTTKK